MPTQTTPGPRWMTSSEREYRGLKHKHNERESENSKYNFLHFVDFHISAPAPVFQLLGMQPVEDEDVFDEVVRSELDRDALPAGHVSNLRSPGDPPSPKGLADESLGKENGAIGKPEKIDEALKQWQKEKRK